MTAGATIVFPFVFKVPEQISRETPNIDLGPLAEQIMAAGQKNVLRRRKMDIAWSVVARLDLSNTEISARQPVDVLVLP